VKAIRKEEKNKHTRNRANGHEQWRRKRLQWGRIAETEIMTGESYKEGGEE
jgi:hypothetical protein